MERGDEEIRAVREKFAALSPAMNEAVRRRWVATEARALGRGGLTWVARATGVSAPTIRRGLRELAAGVELPQRIRRPGAGRKRLTSRDTSLLPDLEDIVRGPSAHALLQWSPLTPQGVLHALRSRGHRLSGPSVLNLLAEGGYRWHAPRSRARESRDEDLLRWRYLEARVRQFLRCAQPVLALDLDRGGVSAAVVAAAPAAVPPPRLLHTGPGDGAPELVSAAVRSWWRQLGPALFTRARDLLLVVGQESALSPRWRRDCEGLAEALGLRVQICLLPAGIYRWSATALPMACHVVREWGAVPRTERRIRVGLVTRASGPEGAGRAELGQALSAAAYPQGLIDPEGGSAAMWTLQARPRVCAFPGSS